MSRAKQYTPEEAHRIYEEQKRRARENTRARNKRIRDLAKAHERTLKEKSK